MMTTFFAHFSSDFVLYLQLSLGTCLHSCLATSWQFSLGTLWQLKLGTCWLLEPAGNSHGEPGHRSAWLPSCSVHVELAACLFGNLQAALLGNLLAVLPRNLLAGLFRNVVWQCCSQKATVSYSIRQKGSSSATQLAPTIRPKIRTVHSFFFIRNYFIRK